MKRACYFSPARAPRQISGNAKKVVRIENLLLASSEPAESLTEPIGRWASRVQRETQYQARSQTNAEYQIVSDMRERGRNEQTKKKEDANKKINVKWRKNVKAQLTLESTTAVVYREHKQI